jgi:hypothetical protein
MKLRTITFGIVATIAIGSCKKPELSADELNYNVYDTNYNGPDYITFENVYADTVDYGNWINVYHNVTFRVNTDLLVNGVSAGTKIYASAVIESPGFEPSTFGTSAVLNIENPILFIHPIIPGTSATIKYAVYLKRREMALKKHTFEFTYP